ncbi:ligand-effect modulator 3 family [Neurospora intermedia]|uniref:Ligand-effect modulator 3 family n=1 Tax=Neurospora intermedia TaxID=5142 RepID=A0ABR3CZH5_NEUIN
MAPRRRRGGRDGSQDGNSSETDAPKNRPPNTAFRQQRMRAWQCVLTPKLIVSIFTVLAAIYLGFGAYLTYLAFTVRDISIDYTDCLRDAPRGNDTRKPIPPDNIKSHFTSKALADHPNLDPKKMSTWHVEEQNVTFEWSGITAPRNICVISFPIPEELPAPVSFYYHLDNFYQNHRRYVNSFNAKQLLGDAVSKDVIDGSTCKPLDLDPRGSGKVIYPCGVVANSMFNDTFSNPYNEQNSTDYVMSNKAGDISWEGLKDLYGETKYSRADIVPPPNWEAAWPNGYTNDTKLPDLKNWADFQNWMMLAASPDFYKLVRKNERDAMKAGNYRIEIVDNFNTTVYNGHKSIVLTTITAMGARNIWPGIIFLIVGGICLILDIYFVLSFFIWKPRKLGDPSYLSWNQPSAAQAGST